MAIAARKFIICCVAAVFAVGLAEFGLRALGRRPFTVFSERTVFWSYHSQLGWHHRPNQHGVFETGSVQANVSSNSRGLRDREYPYARVPGHRRVLVIGDSFAWGYGVDQNHVFSEVLEAALERAEVINAGVSGYSTDQELLWLRTEGVKYRPDLVILQMAGNDEEMNRRKVAYLVYPKPMFSLTEGDELRLHNVPVPQASVLRRLAFQGSSRSAFVNLLVGRSSQLVRTLRAPNSRDAVPTAVREPFALTIALVSEARKVATAIGARFMIVTTDMFWPHESDRLYARFCETLRRQHGELLDIESDAGFNAETMRLPGDGHWNQAGHAFVAERILALIERRGLLNPEPLDLSSPG